MTGKTPGELFFRRKFRDKIQSTENIKSTLMDGDVREREKLHKEKGREYADQKRKASDNLDLEIGNHVCQKNLIKENKLTPNFSETTQLTVVGKKGVMFWSESIIPVRSIEGILST